MSMSLIKLYICEEKSCKRHYKPFISEDELKRHRYFYHKKFKCNDCPLICDNIYELCKHKKAHKKDINQRFLKFIHSKNEEVLNSTENYNNLSPKNKFKPTNDSMDKKENNSINVKIKCQWIGCDKELTEEELSEHISNHLLNPFSCDNCEECFSDETLLNEHKNSAHNLKQTLINNFSTLKSHLNTNIDTNYGSQENLEIDININYKESDIRKTSAGFECHFFRCFETFDDIKDFESHLIIHSNANHISARDYVKNSAINGIYGKQHKCQIKGCRFNSGQEYVSYKHVNTHFGQNPFRCEIKNCFKQFNDRVKCREHEISHYYKETVPKCLWPGCATYIFDRIELFKHVNQHLELKVDCRVCGKQFLRSSHLEAHKIVHNLNGNDLMIDLSYYYTHESNGHYICKWPNCQYVNKGLMDQMTLHIKQHYGISQPIASTTSTTSSIDQLSFNASNKGSNNYSKSLSNTCSVSFIKNTMPSTSSSSTTTISSSSPSHIYSPLNKTTDGFTPTFAPNYQNVFKADEKSLTQIYKLQECEVRLVRLEDIKNDVSNIQREVKLIDYTQNHISNVYGLKRCEVKVNENIEKTKRYALNRKLTIFD